MKLFIAVLFAASAFGQYTFSGIFCISAVGSDAYACTPNAAVISYQTGAFYAFKADVANTGTASFNAAGLGAKTIVIAAGGVTTTLSDNAIRAGQLVVLQYDGTNMQMQSTSGITPAASTASTTVNSQTCALGSSCTVTVPVSTGVTGLGTGVATALAANVGGVGGVVTGATYWGPLGSVTVSVGAVTNTTSCSGFFLPTAVTFGHLVFAVNVADNTNPSDVGIYNAAGMLIGDTGAFISSVTGVRTLAVQQGTVTIPQGKAYFCVTSASNTITFYKLSAPPTFFTFGSVSSATSGGVLNSSFTPPADAYNLNANLIVILLIP